MSKSRTNTVVEDTPPAIETGAPLTISEAARALGKSPTTVARWITEGWLSYVKLPSGLVAVPRSEIDKALTVHRNNLKLES